MASRRLVVLALAAGALAPLGTLAQQPAKVWRIGFLAAGTPGSAVVSRVQSSLREGMREYGYVEGRNLQIEVRLAEGKLERLPALASELAALNVDVMVVLGTAATDAALKATKTIPIVMATSNDPVGDGHAKSLARPGGNLTGLSAMSPELGAKRIQLLKEMFPKLSRTLAVMWNPASPGMRARFDQAKSAGPKLGLGVQSIEVTDLDQIGKAFEAMSKQPPDALVVVADPFTLSQSLRIVEFAATKRLPAIYDSRDFVEGGGLMSYGPDQLVQFRRTAFFRRPHPQGCESRRPLDRATDDFRIRDQHENREGARDHSFAIPAGAGNEGDRVVSICRAAEVAGGCAFLHRWMQFSGLCAGAPRPIVAP